MTTRCASHSIAAGLGAALLGCTMPNPAFDGNETGETGDEAPNGDGDDETGDGDGDTGDGDTGEGDGETGDSDTGDGGDEIGDGDGDGDTGEGDGDPLCEAPLAYLDCDLTGDGLTSDPFAALGLGCAADPSEAIPITAASFAAEDEASWRVAESFGIALGPNHGGKLWAARDAVSVPAGDPELPDIPPNTSAAILILSTGTLPEPDEDGRVVLEPFAQAQLGNNGNPDGGELPAPISPSHGSNFGQGGTPFVDCDLINDCSDSLHEQWFELGWDALHDKLSLSFSMVAPAGVHGYMFDFAFFSAEYPAWIGTPYNDMFVAWSASEGYTGNLTFIGQAPMNTTSLSEAGGFDYTGVDPGLAGTGFETHGGTGWLLARGPASPGEAVEVTLFVSDLGDHKLGSVVLLDNFRWDCLGCEGADCGFSP